ncbi:MAG TPA: PAS domain S-box protein [bacterium]|nr:PAS domain S-box protein [bacterium]
MKILILDAVASDADALEKRLRRRSITVKVRRAHIKAVFLRELREFQPDIILADYTLPDLNGIDALTLAGDLAPKAPFIFVTAHNGEAVAVRCMKSGAFDYVLKDKIEDLDHVLERAETFIQNNAVPITAHFEMAPEQFRRIAESTRDLITVIDIEGRRIYTSPSYGDYLDTHQVEQGSSFFDEIVAEDLPKVKQTFYEVIHTGNAMVVEHRIMAKDRKLMFVEAQWNPIFDNSEKPVHIQIASRIITRRKRAEDALREHVRQYRAMVEHIADAISLINPYGIVLFTSRSTHRVTGYNISEFVSQNFFDFIHPQDRAEALEYFQQVQAKEGMAPYTEMRIRHKDGNYIWIEGLAKNMLHDPNVNAIVFNYRDITEWLRSEAALREKDELFRALIENNSDAITLMDAEGQIKFSVHSVLGYDDAEAVGQNIFDSIHPEDQDRIAEVFEQLIEAPGTSLVAEYRAMHKDGSWRWNECTAKNLLKEPHVRAIVINARDVTDRKLTERALSEEKERLLVTLQALGDGVITTNTEGRIILMNPSAERIIGSSLTTTRGQTIKSVFPLLSENGENKTAHPVDVVLNEQQTVAPSEFTYKVAGDQSPRSILAGASPIRDMSGAMQGVVMVFSDITDRIKMEQELLKSRKIESIGVLAGGIAHDFNNILSAIMGNISLAKVKIAAAQKDKAQELLSRAERASERAKELTQQLLTFSKGGAPVKKTANIADLLRESAQFSSAGSNVRCEFFIQDNLYPSDVDAGQISQVLNNLIINARQAMPNGGIIRILAQNHAIQSHNEGMPLKPGSYLKIAIEDNGCGISEEHLQRIFDPYFTTKQTGNGLGLATSYSIIKNHDGAITVDSKINVGTTFTLYLPASKFAVQQPRPQEPQALLSNGRILVMDDEESIREMASNMLNHLGFDAVSAKSGEEAVAMYEDARARNKAFDAIIMDLTIPGGLGGKDAMARILSIDPAVCGIVSSGYSNDPVMADHTRYGFQGILPKPYFINDLSRVLNQLLKPKT